MAILWVLLLMAGAWRISRRPVPPRPVAAAAAATGCFTELQKKSMPHWIATRPMPLNWLVRAADLVAPEGGSPAAITDFTGQYAVCKIAAGNSLVATDLAPAPRIPVKSGKLLFPFPLSGSDAGFYNAGELMDVFDGTTEVVIDAEVAAVDCKGACVAWLQLSEAERQLMDQKKSAAFRLIARSVSEGKGTP